MLLWLLFCGCFLAALRLEQDNASLDQCVGFKHSTGSFSEVCRCAKVKNLTKLFA